MLEGAYRLKFTDEFQSSRVPVSGETAKLTTTNDLSVFLMKENGHMMSRGTHDESGKFCFLEGGNELARGRKDSKENVSHEGSDLWS